jgi:hypothetical protein
MIGLIDADHIPYIVCYNKVGEPDKSLEEAISQLRNFNHSIKICLVKPGAVATQPDQIDPYPFANVNEWAQKLVSILDVESNLEISEIALGVNYG